jgi:diguanylate cyclase (GGDEF)-like protein
MVHFELWSPCSTLSVLRPYDFLCRIGGDEFMIVLNVDLAQSQALGERLRALVASSPIGFRQNRARVAVTLSIGLARASPVTTNWTS